MSLGPGAVSSALSPALVVSGAFSPTLTSSITPAYSSGFTPGYADGGAPTPTGGLSSALSPTLGISASEIEQRLATGSSLSQIATQQGVLQTTLLQAVKAAISSESNGASLSPGELDATANTMLNTPGLALGLSGGSGQAAGSGRVTGSAPAGVSLAESLAATLGLGASQIEKDLAGGSSLSKIAANQGVSQSTLLEAVKTALSRSGHGETRSASELATMANEIINATGPAALQGGLLDGATTISSQGSVSTLASQMMVGWLAQDPAPPTASAGSYRGRSSGAVEDPTLDVAT